MQTVKAVDEFCFRGLPGKEDLEPKMSFNRETFFKNMERNEQNSFSKVYNIVRRNHVFILFDSQRKTVIKIHEFRFSGLAGKWGFRS